MKGLRKGLHVGLCLWLCSQLALPAVGWAKKKQGATGERDLTVEEMHTQSALWVLSIGVSKYADSSINLKYADHDAEAIARILETQRGRLFREVYTKVIVNEQATREAILKAMKRFLGQASQNDVVLIFLAGHGVQDRQTQTYYFIPSNATGDDDLISSGLPMPMFQEATKGLLNNVNKIILWLDTCHAGAMTLAARGVDPGEDLAEALAQASGQYVLSASKAGEKSFENDKWRFEGKGEGKGHGAFTYSLLEGLYGQAAGADSIIWLSELFTYVSRAVPILTEGGQHPHTDIQGTDLPFFAMKWPPDSVTAPHSAGGSLPAPFEPTKSHKRLWLLMLGTAAVGGGGAAVFLGSGGSSQPSQPPATGSIEYDIAVP